MPKISGKNDPHMKTPYLKYILIIGLIVLLVIFLAPKIVKIYNDNLNETNERANK